MKYIIKIPEPCNKRWHQLTPTQKGAYCSQCEREVVDLTHKSKFELGQLLNDNKKLCGKFKPEQLNTPINFNANYGRSGLGLFLGISSLFVLTTPAFSQIKLPKTLQIQNKVSPESNSTDKEADSVFIRGQILADLDGLPLPGAHIFLKGTSHGAQADFDGYFNMKVDKADLGDSAIIIASYIGFDSREIRIHPNTEFLKIVLKEGGELMGEVIIIEKPNIFKRMGNLFKRKNKNTVH